MSSFYGNAIHLDESPEEIAAKVLRLPDSVVLNYFTQLTREPMESILRWKELLSNRSPVGDHLKQRLASELARFSCHGM
jgi:tyrosyl-tRNA synthetase